MCDSRDYILYEEKRSRYKLINGCALFMINSRDFLCSEGIGIYE